METHQPYPEDFLLSEGGPYHRALEKMRLHKRQGKLSIVVLFITWLPLVIITAIEGTLYSGVQIPFIKDVGMQARLLVAIPMLIMIKLSIDSKVLAVARYISEALITTGKQHEVLNTMLEKAKRLTSSAITEALLLTIERATISIHNISITI